jgi:hypothetical protein
LKVVCCKTGCNLNKYIFDTAELLLIVQALLGLCLLESLEIRFYN